MRTAFCAPEIAEADFLLPETGTLVLRSSAEKPRAVSLLPCVHLAIVRPEIVRADLHQVFAEAKDSHYLVFITEPSRTAEHFREENDAALTPGIWVRCCGYCAAQIRFATENALSRYSLGVTPDHFLNALRKTLGSEKPNKYVICSTV